MTLNINNEIKNIYIFSTSLYQILIIRIFIKKFIILEYCSFEKFLITQFLIV